MYCNNQIAFELPDLQHHNPLTHCWRSFSEWGKERVALSFPYKASQYFIDEWLQQIATQITNDVRTKIIDAPWTLILPWVYPPYVIIYFGIVYD